LLSKDCGYVFGVSVHGDTTPQFLSKQGTSKGVKMNTCWKGTSAQGLIWASQPVPGPIPSLPTSVEDDGMSEAILA